jgi:hypothetical protein
MSYKKFEDGDLFYNVIKTKPRYEFKIWKGAAYINIEPNNVTLNNVNISGSSTI